MSLQRNHAIEGLLREAAPRALAAVARRFGDFAEAEDAVQEAMIDAARQWPAQGLPESPTGWLIHVASRRMTDRIRSEAARRDREQAVAGGEPQVPPPPGGAGEADDTLLLMFMCCHPALTPASAIALTLRAVAGLSTTEIAAAFLVPEQTMAQRISRAKKTIKDSGEQFAMPAAEERAERLRSVLRVVYLIFNEGYAVSEGTELARADLAAEAIRLGRIVHLATPTEPEAGGLLALMLLTEARRPARTDARGELIPLEEQDRSLWDRGLIEEGASVLAMALSHGAVGEYQLQAAIAAEHAQALRPQDTNWREILALYGLLEQVTANPMVTLNRAIAAAMVDGPQAGLALLGELKDRLAGHHRLHSTRAHLLEQAGEPGAAAEYERAAALTKNLPERNYLTKQAARLNRAG
ncbi:MAG TPA: sigma-70 family RNA polymerase sigma factor [Solirubrobacterales bacterium]|nr:sigma-70 family RNA polymerase sigma factor [Solirubrobacterales bacterium]